MKIIIITQNAPIYLPGFLDDLIRLLSAGGHKLAGIVVLSPYSKNSPAAEIFRRLNYYGLRDFLRMSLYVAGNRSMGIISRLLPLQNCHSVRAAARKHAIPLIRINAVNNDNFVQYVKANAVDIVISVAAPEIFGSQLLQSPRVAAINYHTGALPSYRGRQPLFWAMLNNEKTVSITVHEMTEILDGGPILSRIEIPVTPDDTLHTLYLKTVAVGPAALAEAVSKIATGDTSRTTNIPDGHRPYGFPDAKAVSLFRRRKKKFF